MALSVPCEVMLQLGARGRGGLHCRPAHIAPYEVLKIGSRREMFAVLLLLLRLGYGTGVDRDE